MTAELDMSRSLRPLFEPEAKPERLLATAMQKTWVCALPLSGASDLIMEPSRATSWANAVALFVSDACRRPTAPFTPWESLLIQTFFLRARRPESLAGSPYRRRRLVASKVKRLSHIF